MEVTYDALQKQLAHAREQIETQAARIAELEAAIHQYVNEVVNYEGTSFIDDMT